MKKQLLFALFLMCSIYGFSQGIYGVRAGGNISNLDFKDDPFLSNKHRNGFFISFFGEYELRGRFNFAPEIQFSAEGAKLKEIRLDYIQVPLLLKYRVSEKATLLVGPQLSLKTYKFEDKLTPFGGSVLGGLEVMITNEIFAEARYSYGLTNIFDKEVGAESRNNNAQIGLGVKF